MIVGVLAMLPLAALSPAEAAGCTQTPKRSVSFRATGSTITYWTYLSHSGQVSYSEKRRVRGPKNVGQTTVSFRLCKDRNTAKWRILDATIAEPHQDLTMVVTGGTVETIKPRSGSYGWGTFVRRLGKDRALKVDVVRCTKQPAKTSATGVARGLTSLPWPGPFAVSVGAAVVNKLLPKAPADKYWCGGMGPTISLPVLINAQGVPRIPWARVGQEIRMSARRWQQPCSQAKYCTETFEDSVSIHKP